MKAIILAAGKGTRLLPLTLETPKTLVEISGKPIIVHIIESLPEEIDEVVVVVSHLKDEIKKFLGDSFLNKKIFYTEQGEIPGTFGAVLSTKNLFSESERFLVTNGDDIHGKHEFLDCIKYPRAMAVQKKIMPNYFSIQVNKGYFSGFKSQTEDEKINGTLVATGVYVLDTNIFQHPGVLLSTGEYGLPQSVFAQTTEFPVNVVVTDEWLPVNSFEDMEKANEYFSSK